MAYAIIKSTSAFESSSETTAPRYLKLVTVSRFCLTPGLALNLDAISAVCGQLVLSVLISINTLCSFCLDSK